MAVKGVCTIIDVLRNNADHTHFDVSVRYAALDDASVAGTHVVNDLDPSLAAATVTTQIESAMKTYLQGEGITIGLLDSVRLLPAI